MEENSLISLWDDAIPLEKIPVYPSNEIKIAVEGDLTFDLDPNCNAQFGDGRRVDTVRRPAIPGEPLRDADLRLMVDTRNNLIHRGTVLAVCDDNVRAQAIQIEYCRSSILYFINTFCWITEPGEPPIPFVTYEVQDKFLKWLLWVIKFHKSALLIKSRKMGATWMMRAVHAYLNMFFENNISFSMSMSGPDVDNFTVNSLMGKQRCIYDNMPKWLRFGWERDDKVTDKAFYIGMPNNNSFHEGRLSGGTAGRGGRASFIDYDEFAWVERDVETTEASITLAYAELFLSTVHGIDNEFARMAYDPAQVKYEMRWEDHPLLDWKWALLERSKGKYTDEKWNQEMERMFEGSQKGRVWPTLKSKYKGPNEWCHIQEGQFFEYDPAYEVDLGIDFGISSPNAVVYCQEKPCPSHFQNNHGTTLIVFMTEEATDQTYGQLADMILKHEFNIRYFVGDMVSAVGRTWEGNTLVDLLAGEGIPLVGHRYSSQEGPITCVQKYLEMAGAFAINKHKAPWMATAMQQWSYPVDPRTGIRIPGSAANRRSKYSHICTALMYLCAWLMGYKEIDKKKKTKRNRYKTQAIRRAML